MGGLGDLFSLSGGPGISGGMYSAPKQVRDNFFRLIYSARTYKHDIMACLARVCKETKWIPNTLPNTLS